MFPHLLVRLGEEHHSYCGDDVIFSIFTECFFSSLLALHQPLMNSGCQRGDSMNWSRLWLVVFAERLIGNKCILWYLLTTGSKFLHIRFFSLNVSPLPPVYICRESFIKAETILIQLQAGSQPLLNVLVKIKISANEREVVRCLLLLVVLTSKYLGFFELSIATAYPVVMGFLEVWLLLLLGLEFLPLHFHPWDAQVLLSFSELLCV